MTDTVEAKGDLGAETNGGRPEEFPRIEASTMTDTVDDLVLDLLEWLGSGPRPYAEVMEAWRTSCPRLPVWEEANDRGFVRRLHMPGVGAFVSVSDRGTEHLQQARCHEVM